MAQPNWHRICVGCGRARHKKELLRVVKGRDHEFEIDWKGNRPGRGAYICPNSDCARLAKKRRGLSRAFKMEVPLAFYDKLIRDIDRGSTPPFSNIHQS